MKGDGSLEEIKDMGYYNALAMQAASNMEAFEELYREFFPRVYNFLFARLKNTAASDDVVSVVFMKAYQNLSKYDSRKAAFSTWLFRIASNAVVDYCRVKANQAEEEWKDHFQPEASERETPESRLLAEEGAEELLCALDQLGERERRIIALKYWSGLSNKEIAEVMGISAGNVGVTLFRAVGTLRKILEDGKG